MKRHLLVAIILLCIVSVNGQEVSSKKQRIIKIYNPYIAGVSSLIISGAGQMYCGEYLRGLKFMGGIVLGSGLVIVNLAENCNSRNLIGEPGLITLLVTKIWSVNDAVLLAKEKSLKNRNSISFKIKPKIGQNLIQEKSIGVSCALNF